MFAAVSTSLGRPVRDDAAVLQQDELAAQRRRQVQIVRRHDHRRAALAVQARRAARRFRTGSRGRATPSARRAAARRDACASAPAMTTRCFSPPLSVANGATRAPRCRSRRAHRARWPGRRRLRARTRRDADSGPSARCRATVKSNVECVSCGTTAMRRASSRRDKRATRRAVERARVRAAGVSVPASSCSSVVLPEPFGPSRPTIAPRGTRYETSSSTRRRRR